MSGWLTDGMGLINLPATGNERFPLDTQLAAGANPQMEAISLSQAAMYMGMGATVPWVTGRFYGWPAGAVGSTFLTVTSTLYAYPLYIPATTIKTVSNAATTGQTGGNSHIGLYADNGAGYPGNLVSDFGVIGALTGTGVVTSTLTSPLAVNSGLYWVSSIFTATSTFPTVVGISPLYTNTLNMQLGFPTAADAAATTGFASTGISVAGTYGALPATFPASATLDTTSATPLAFFGV